MKWTDPSGQWLVDSGQKDADDNFIYFFRSLLNK